MSTSESWTDTKIPFCQVCVLLKSSNAKIIAVKIKIMVDQEPSLTRTSSQSASEHNQRRENTISIRPNGLVELTRIPQSVEDGLTRPVTIIGEKEAFSGPTQELIEAHEESLKSDGTVGAINPKTNKPQIVL